MHELDELDRALLNRIVEQQERMERWRKPLERRWTHAYAMWRSYQGFRDAWEGATDRRDRDDIIGDGQREWGAKLVIPWVFWTIESLVPRVISNRPRGAILPEDQLADENVENMRFVIERQQERIGYELICQSTAKSGLTYGLGVQKSRWRFETVERMKLLRMTLPDEDVKFQQAGPFKEVMFDDADAVDVDIFDFFWDETAATVEAARYLNHRVFRDTDYVVRMCGPTGPWRHLGDALTPQDIASTGSDAKYNETHSERMRAQGMTAGEGHGNQLHELWEWHTGTELVVILDRRWPVYVGPNPAWHGRKPFHTYTPTLSPSPEFAGVGEPEQIEHLFAEMNTMRSQRRDNATLKLMQSYAYDMGRVDPKNIKIGPGLLTGVNGDPNNILAPMQVGDIPFSSYREEDSLARDIERTVGLSDQVMGTAQASGTATEAQLTVAQANIRIQNKTRLLELGPISGVLGDWIDLNQQMIVQERTIRIPYTPGPGEPPDRVWAWRKIGPAGLAGRMVYTVEGGSTGPENVQEKRQVAQMLLTATPVIGPFVDQRKWVEKILSLIGFHQPEQLMAQDPRLAPEVLDVLAEELVNAGMPQPNVVALIQQAVQEGMQRAEEAQQQQQAQGLPPAGGSGQPPQPGAPPPQPPEQ